jgi:hypothetical protein
MNFIISKKEIFLTNSFIHNINTSHKHHHRPNASLSYFKKCTVCAGIKIFKSLPPSTTILKNDKAKLTAALRKYLLTRSFYSIDEFFCVKISYNTVFVKCW